MKINKLFTLFLALSFGFICACASTSAGKNKSDSSAAQELTAQERAHLAFYIYADYKSVLNHFYPSGWMGDSRDLAFDQACRKGVYAGKTCIKVTYTPRGTNKWSGVYWQQPANNWGDKQGGYNLSKATYLTFWMKGETGNETLAEIKIGGQTGEFPDSSVSVMKNVKLTKEWKLYWIDLKKKDMSYISGGFAFVVNKKDNPNGCTFYIDEVRYEMNK